MKSCVLYSSALLGAVLAFGQTTTSVTPATSPTAAPAGQLHVRGPEAVAQQSPDKVVATIGGKPITAKQALDILNFLPSDQRKRYESNLPQLVQQIYMSQQLADEAGKMNLDRQSPWKEQLQLARTQVLAQAYLSQVANNSSAGAQATDPQQYYNAHPEEFDQVKLKGIFVSFNAPGTPANAGGVNRTEEQARTKVDDLEKKLKTGADFSTLARTDSDNQQAAANGGDLGAFSLGNPQLPPDLKAAIGKLQPGQTSDPIRLPNALLIVKLDSRSKLTFDQAKPGIVSKMQSEKSQAAMKQETEKYKIQVQDTDFFGGAAPLIPSLNTPSLQRPAPATTTPPPSGATTPRQ